MGWLWSSGAAPKGNAPVAPSSNTETQPAPPPEPTYSDPEIAKFMAQLQAEFGGSSNNNTTTKSPTPTTSEPKAETSQSTSSSSSSSWWPSRSSTQPAQTSTASPSPSTISPQTSAQASPARLDPLSESLLPTTMSCRQAFDHAYHCNSLGGQWTAVYRSGTVRSCSEQWDDFWFCMRTRAYSGAVKEEAIKDYYRQKELKKYGSGKPNSTDIWEPRTERLPPDSAFQERYVKPDINDEEWYRLEIERQRMIQQMLKEEERTVS
ncbi:hypothetical protein FHL15_009706 [Xylaria flabelliformis]|uniref:Early meiotic induction protein 1 n=1 Tax=Xylaria flabelliformis TaxID=2512241 RepID=A0A553HN74_9PEZI|nr:hypothetical protein FHL15_009706 [Xylaria flabelliformis]